MKWLTPAFLVTFGGLTALATFAGVLKGQSPQAAPLLIAFACLGWAAFRIRAILTVVMDSVTYDSSSLKIRRNKIEDIVALANIDRVKDNTFCRPEKITVIFKA